MSGCEIWLVYETDRGTRLSPPWDSEGLTSNGTRHLATFISVICEFGIGRCLFKEPRSGSQCSFPFNRAIFVSDHPFDWTSADTKGILHPGDWDKMEKSAGTAGLGNPLRNLSPPIYSFFIYCNHRQKCWEGCYFLPLILFLLPPPLAQCQAKL